MKSRQASRTIPRVMYSDANPVRDARREISIGRISEVVSAWEKKKKRKGPVVLHAKERERISFIKSDYGRSNLIRKLFSMLRFKQMMS